MNRVVDHAYGGQSRAVPVIPLDRLHAAGHSCCWKVDVEGLEPEVLAGATHSLRSPILRAVLLEGRQPEVQSTMREHGFEPCRYDPWSRRLFSGCVVNASEGQRRL